MYDKGLGINLKSAERIQNNLEEKLSFQISSLIDNLTDSNLIPKTEINIKPGGYTFANVVSITFHR